MERRSWGWYALFGALYFVQGCSGALVNVTLLYVMYKQGWTKSMGGDFLAVAMLPWTWKIVLAPLIDRRKIVCSLGSKPGWILLSTVAAVTCLAVLPLVGSWFAGILLLVVCHNVARSVQDIAVDGWAVEVCGQKKSRPTQAAMRVGSALGGLAGGGGALYLFTVMPWAVICMVAAMVCAGVVIVPLLVLWQVGWRPSADVVGNEASVSVGWGDFFGVFRGIAPLALVVAALLIQVPEGVTGPIVYRWFMDLGYDDAHVAWIVSWVSVAKICGALAIGLVTAWLVQKPEKLFATAIVARSIGYVAVGAFSGLWGTDGFVFVMAIVTSFMDVVVVVLFCATVMEVCNKRVAATQFAVYMSIMNIGIAWTSWVGGRLGEVISTAQLFFVSGWAGLIVLIPLVVVFLRSREGRADTRVGIDQ
jgi:PAT family beta-lactamase induction signal transducer AmpG